MELRAAFGDALKTIRSSRGLTQEDFSAVSSRTYLSTLERGLKSPTIDKIDELADVLQVHPLTLLSRCYAKASGCSLEELFARVKKEVEGL